MELLSKVYTIFYNHPFNNIYTDGYKNVYDLLYAHDELYGQFRHPTINDGTLIEKYKENIPNGWYGFSIGSPVNPVWMEIIDEVLELYKEADPNFEIHQIKMKFGGIDFYVDSEIVTDKWEIARLISSTLRDNALIY